MEQDTIIPKSKYKPALTQLIFGHLSTLLLGGVIYILFRSESLLMFSWFDVLNINDFLITFHKVTFPIKSDFASWFLYSLPDGLWLFSYEALILFVWCNQVSKSNVFWLMLMPIIAIVSEFGQLVNVIPGTFDMIDLILYAMGTILPLRVFKSPKTTS